MVNIITKKHILNFAENHPIHMTSLERWLSVTKKSTWKKPQDIITTYGTKATDLIGNNRVVIDIKGNHIRIIAKYQIHHKLNISQLYIKWIGLHSDYDKLNKFGKQHTVDMFKEKKL